MHNPDRILGALVHRCQLRVILYLGRRSRTAHNVRFTPFASEFAWRRNMWRRATGLMQCNEKNLFDHVVDALKALVAGQ